MTPWDFRETHALVERAYGSEQLALVRPCLRSIVDRQNFGKYHYQESQRLIKAFQRRHLNDKMLMVALHGGREHERSRVAFEHLMIKAGAHITACIQCLHAVPDILASAVYFGSGLNLTAHPLKDRDVSIKAVVAAARANADLRRLGDLLDIIASGSQYEHLSALSNLSKHRTIIRTSLNEDWTGSRQDRYELHLTSFNKQTGGGTKEYAQASVAFLLVPESERLSRHVIDVGHELNASLRRIAP